MTPAQPPTPTGATTPAELLAALSARDMTLAVAESLTGGALAAAIVDVPGASTTFRGGVVAYATDLKASVLGVDEGLLAARGPVDGDVAAAMALGVARLLGADLGLATTGEAGPDPQGDAPVGTVFVAAAGAGGTAVRRLTLAGGRSAIRRAAVEAVVQLAGEAMSRVADSRG